MYKASKKNSQLGNFALQPDYDNNYYNSNVNIQQEGNKTIFMRLFKISEWSSNIQQNSRVCLLTLNRVRELDFFQVHNSIGKLEVK